MKKKALALNHSTELATNRATSAVALAPDASGEPPVWVELIPAGARVVGRDGREWLNDRPADVVAIHQALATPLPIDEEHATDLAAPRGEPAPAAAWIEELAVREGGSIWGRTDWTPPGAELVRNRQYRWLSPVFEFEPGTGRIIRIARAALTNVPNLRLTALNRQQEEDPMDRKKLCTALGLPESATDDEITAKLGSLSTAANRVATLEGELATARNRAEIPDPTKFVPRADLEQALNRATTAEDLLKERDATALNATIDAEVTAAQQAGKIAPASADHWKALCRKEGGLEQFRALLATLPVIAADTALNAQRPAGDGSVDAAALELGKVFGNSAEDLKTYGGR